MQLEDLLIIPKQLNTENKSNQYTLALLSLQLKATKYYLCTRLWNKSGKNKNSSHGKNI
jgi:uncharacterized membrane protein